MITVLEMLAICPGIHIAIGVALRVLAPDAWEEARRMHHACGQWFWGDPIW